MIVNHSFKSGMNRRLEPSTQVQNGDSRPTLLNRRPQFSERSWANSPDFLLQQGQDVFNQVQVLAVSRPNGRCDSVVCEEPHCCLCPMSRGVILQHKCALTLCVLYLVLCAQSLYEWIFSWYNIWSWFTKSYPPFRQKLVYSYVVEVADFEYHLRLHHKALVSDVIFANEAIRTIHSAGDPHKLGNSPGALTSLVRPRA